MRKPQRPDLSISLPSATVTSHSSFNARFAMLPIFFLAAFCGMSGSAIAQIADDPYDLSYLVKGAAIGDS